MMGPYIQSHNVTHVVGFDMHKSPLYSKYSISLIPIILIMNATVLILIILIKSERYSIKKLIKDRRFSPSLII